MAETPEEIAKHASDMFLGSRATYADCRAYIASVLRAQYVAGQIAGLEAAAREAEEFDPDGGIGDPLASRIRALAEQAKREGT